MVLFVTPKEREYQHLWTPLDDSNKPGVSQLGFAGIDHARTTNHDMLGEVSPRPGCAMVWTITRIPTRLDVRLRRLGPERLRPGGSGCWNIIL
jgi:hypothetical protein